MTLRKELNNIRIEKKSPLFVRKSKLFSWLLTIISLLFLASFIALLVTTILKALNLAYVQPPSDINKNDAIHLLNIIIEPFDLLSASLTIFSCFFISFFIFKIVSCIFNIIRYISDYKRDVVPVKSVLVFRIVSQILMIIFLAIGIIFSCLGMLKLFDMTNSNIKDATTLTKDTIIKIQAISDPNDRAEIEQIMNDFDSKLQDIIQRIKNMLDFVKSSDLILFIIIGFSCKVLWILSLIFYGITIKIILSSIKKSLGVENSKTSTNKNDSAKDMVTPTKDNDVENEIKNDDEALKNDENQDQESISNNVENDNGKKEDVDKKKK